MLKIFVRPVMGGLNPHQPPPPEYATVSDRRTERSLLRLNACVRAEKNTPSFMSY